MPSFLSPHFTLEEMTASDVALRLGIDNSPGEVAIGNLRRLTLGYLEVARGHIGAIITTSGYRCPALNEQIHGSKTSAHMDGRAHDGRAQNLPLHAYMEWWVGLSGLPYDQCIYEFGGWVHIGIARAGEAPRRENLMIFTLPDWSSTGYLPWDAKRIEPVTGMFKG